MNQIFRFSGTALLAVTGGFFLASAPVPTLAQTSQSITCQPSTVSVSPSSGSLVVSCTSPGGGTPPPPSCAIAFSPASLTSVGGSVQVTASNCGTISSWSGAVSSAAIAATTTSPIPATFTDTLADNSTGTVAVAYAYSVTGTGGTATKTISVPAPSSTGGGGGGVTTCGSKTVGLDWGPSTRQTVTIAGNGAVVAQFTVGTPSSSYPHIGISNNASSSKVQYALASSANCTLPTKASPDPVLGTVANTTPNFGGLMYFSVPGTKATYGTPLTQGTTYYVIVQNVGSTSASYFIDLYN